MGKLMANSPWGKPTSALLRWVASALAWTRPAMLDDWQRLAMRLTWLSARRALTHGAAVGGLNIAVLATASPVSPKSSNGTAHSGPPVSGRSRGAACGRVREYV